jgi:hypothetical protein
MSTVSDPATAGQDSTDHAPLTAAEARTHMRELARLTRALERYLDQAPEEDEDGPPSGPEVAPLALRCDGVVLLHVQDLEGVDLSGREVWTGIALYEAEAADLQERLSHGIAESAGIVGGWILRNTP